MLVELKNGETLNGHLVTCDTWMNLTLKEVVQTSPVCFVSSLCFGAVDELKLRGMLDNRRRRMVVGLEIWGSLGGKAWR